MKSILKDKKVSIDLEMPFSLKRFIETTAIKENLKNVNSVILNSNRINNINGLYHVKSFKNITGILKSFLDLKLEVSSIFNYIENLMMDKEIILKKPDDVLFYVYIDLFFNYYLLKHAVDTHHSSADKFIENIAKLIGKQVILKGHKDQEAGNTWSQSTLLQTAIGNIEWIRDKAYPYISYNANKYLNEINAKLVEIPKDYDLKRLEHSLEEISSVLDHFEVDNRNFTIRFRKIKKLKKTGLFIVSANTIILDPRETDSFKHELGHYVFENKIPVKIEGEYLHDLNSLVEENRGKYSDMLKKHRIEDYKEDSEIFAFSFEKK